MKDFFFQCLFDNDSFEIFKCAAKKCPELYTYERMLRSYSSLTSVGRFCRCENMKFAEYYFDNFSVDKNVILETSLYHTIDCYNHVFSIYIIKRFEFQIQELQQLSNFWVIFVSGNIDLIRLIVELGYQPTQEDLMQNLNILFKNGHSESFRFMVSTFKVEDFIPFEIQVYTGAFANADVEFLKVLQEKFPDSLQQNSFYADSDSLLKNNPSLEKIKLILEISGSTYKNYIKRFYFNVGVYGRLDIFEYLLTIRPRDEYYSFILEGLLSVSQNTPLAKKLLNEYDFSESELRSLFSNFVSTGDLELVKSIFQKCKITHVHIRERGFGVVINSIVCGNLSVLEFLLEIRGLDLKKLRSAIVKTNILDRCDIFIYDLLVRKLNIQEKIIQ